MPRSKSQNKPQSIDTDRIVKVTAGEPPKPLNAPVTLVEYDPSWPTLFSGEAERIRNALGSDALGIEHVGSTSVSNLLEEKSEAEALNEEPRTNQPTHTHENNVRGTSAQEEASQLGKLATSFDLILISC